jgi:hypothetical protein
MPEPIYQSDSSTEPDSNFVAGELSLAAAGNRGRLLDARRTPLSLTAVDSERCEIEVRIDAFEDQGARWRIPAWEITRLQLALDSKRATPAAAAELDRAVERCNQPLVVEADATAASDTWRRVTEQRARVGAALRSDVVGIDLQACVELREGDPRLYASLDRYLAAQDLLDLDRRFCETMVSNPGSGELIKGHAIVLAELGLCRFQGTLVRDPNLFEEPWSRRRRAQHLIARMAFAQEFWNACVGQPLTLYRAAATDGALFRPRPASFVSCTFSEEVADAHFSGGETTRNAVKWRQAVDSTRLLMTFLETAAFNDRFKEAEAVLLGDRSNPAF